MPPLAVEVTGAGPTLVLVHGFTQTRASTADLASRLGERRCVRVDLPGHGGSADVSADLDGAAALVVEAAGGEPFDVVGYSLGGRVALHVAASAPPTLRSTVAISAHPGLADESARARRLDRDRALAATLDDGDVAGFLDRWLSNPLFATLRGQRAGLDERLANTAKGLADSLVRCSLGAQRPLASELAAAGVPVLMLAGARDDGFVAAACALAREGHVAAAVVPGAGHVCHLERPDVTALLIAAFLDAR
ncbi:MAG TPA: alpha/beta fold hydrolase [Acidimicrobiales bacterium]|nr:alpha/beta fold hydrolase [Acidimicrobiales bacterium]